MMDEDKIELLNLIDYEPLSEKDNTYNYDYRLSKTSDDV